MVLFRQAIFYISPHIGYFMFLRFSFFSILSLTISLFLSGCTDNLKSAIGSAEAFIDNKKGLDISSDYIRTSPYSSSLVSINDSQPILLVLAFAERKAASDIYQLTWLSNDNNVIVTENGRIVHSTGFPTGNLEDLSAVENNLPQPGTAQHWVAHYDWSPGYRYGFSADVHSTLIGSETIQSDLWSQEAEHVKEDIAFTTLDHSFSNHFWVVPQTGTHKAYVIKSIQYLGPNMHKVEMLMVKPFIETLQNTKDSKDSE